MKHASFFLIVCGILLLLPWAGHGHIVVLSELENQIIQQANELEAIESQMEDTEKQIDAIQGQKNTLSREITSLNAQARQVNLGIQLSQINIQKLGLEIDSFQHKIGDTEQVIKKLREGIKKTFQSMQKKEREGFFMLFLRNTTLSDGMTETQNFLDLNNNLTIKSENLNALKTTLREQIRDSEQKKSRVERENKNLKNRIEILSDVRRSRNQILAETRNTESLYQAQLRELQQRREEVGRSIAELEDQLRIHLDPDVLPVKRPGVLAYPLSTIFVTQEYGRTAFAQRAYGTRFHNGIDYRARIGTPVMAAEDGRVIAIGDNGRFQYGRYVLIEHDNNLVTLYAHLSRKIVSRGQEVKRGQVVAYSGNTGFSTGPHLHFTVYVEPSYCRTAWDRSQTSTQCVFLKSFPGAGLVPIGNTINPTDYL